MKLQEKIIKGLPAAPGIAIGPVFKYWGEDVFVERIELNNEHNIQQELKKFRKAVAALLRELESIRDSTLESYGEELAELFELQIGLLKDEILLNEIEEKIITEKINAAYSIYEILRTKKEHLLNLKNEYFRNRAFEIQDLKRKLIARISGREDKLLYNKPAIVVAHDLTPADTMRFFQKNVLGYITETGGINSHAAIMAKALEIPSVVGCDDVLELTDENDTVILDGMEGIVILNPSDTTIEHYQKKREEYFLSLKQLRKKLKKVTQTTDGEKVYVDANLEFVDEISIIKKYKANGVGLFRTEGIFLQSNIIPSEDEQYKIYKKVASEKEFEHVTIRTLDLGGDKILPELQSMEEQNPFLGWRAIRFCLDMQGIFRTQIRAILRANENGNIRILLPFITSFEELQEAKQIIEEEKRKLFEDGYKITENIKIGVMIETPAAVMISDILAEEVDFFSIGTNDLTQYIMAVDRNNPKIADLYNPFNPAVLRAIKEVIAVGKKHGIDVEMCGEMAGNPLAIPLLLGFGLRIFSVGHTHIPTVKQIVSNIDIKEVEQLALEILKLKTAKEVEKVLRIHFKEKFPELEISQI